MNSKRLKIKDVPFLISQWDTSNKEDPSKVSASSRNQYNWKCPVCGYSWTATANARMIAKGSCPCHDTNKAIMPGFNDAFTLVPELKDYYDHETNDAECIDISKEGVGSLMPVNWKCPECNRTWKTSIHSRIRKVEGKYAIVPCPHYNTVKRKTNDTPTVDKIPNMMKFWDTAKNPDASTVKINSTKYAYWRCPSCGYNWRSTIRGREISSGKCACCDLHIVIKRGVTDLFTLVPEAKNSYDFNKNNDVDIYSLGIRNTTKLWWKCPECGNEWQTSIASRVDGTSGNYRFRKCQQCYFSDISRIVSISTNAKLIKYWDFEKNKGIDVNLTSQNSLDSAHWRCKECGYTWEATIKGMIGSPGCPHCNNPDSYIGKHPEIIKELINIFNFDENPHILFKDLKVNTKTMVHFHCIQCDFEWDGVFGNRIRKEEDGFYRVLGCPVCNNNKFRKMTYDKQYPELAAMFNEDFSRRTLASVTSYESNTEKLFWNCPVCNRSFASRLQSMITSLSTSTKGCPYCSNTILIERGSFGDIHPELLDEYADENELDPFDIFPMSKKSVLWRCTENPEHTWHASFTLRHNGGGCCPICNRTKLIKGVNTFEDVYREYLDMYSENNERKPDDIFYNSSLWFKWKCRKCHEEYGAFMRDVLSDEENCPYCNNRRVLPGLNDIKSRYPDIAVMWSMNNPLSADKVLSDTKNWAFWICPDCDGEYRARISDVANHESSCPYCNDRQTLPGFNDFATKYPDLMKEYDIITNYIATNADSISEKSNMSLWWICQKNPEHEYYMSPRKKLWYHKRHRESCPYCKGLRRKKRHFI